MKVKSLSHVRLFTFDPMDCSLPGSSVHRIFQARVLEWVYNQSDFGVDHLVMSTCSRLLYCWKRVFAITSDGTSLQYSCLEKPMDGGPGGPQSMGLLRVGCD